MQTGSSGPAQLLARKSVTTLQTEAGQQGLRRTLGPLNLVLLGIGCILGAGIYVMPGTAAAHFAGPAVMLSFIIAGAACALTALCYAELASTIPVAGSAYTYCYAAMGEVFAWSIGWLLILEYGMAAAMLAVGFSGYFTSLLHDFGVTVPASLATPLIQAIPTGGGTLFNFTGSCNLVAALAIAVITVVLTLGIAASAAVNNVLVAIKIAVLMGFIAIGIDAVNPANWHPFIPPNEGGFVYGWQGVMRAASILFFAYLGFETVSTAAAEARNPSRDLPIGILGSLVACTVIYIVVAAVLTGVVPYRELGVPDPIAIAVDRMGHPGFAILVKIGALMGLSSVLLVNAYGQSRVTFAMSRDGLLPPLFSLLHERFKTPHLGTLLLGAIAALAAALLPLSLLGDLVSIGIGLAFMVVCLSVMWLRTTQPDLVRPFRVPLGGFHVGRFWVGFVPVGAMLMCLVMIVPVIVDLIRQALLGHPAPLFFVAGYALSGVVVYFGYAMPRSKLAAVPA
ncbi:MAG TPA: amino acid permease [Steroidobacteraceae bacterium]